MHSLGSVKSLYRVVVSILEPVACHMFLPGYNKIQISLKSLFLTLDIGDSILLLW